MLVYCREVEEGIVIGDDILVKVVAVRGDVVRLGIVAPSQVPVHRKEVQEAILLETGLTKAQSGANRRPKK